LAKGLCLSLEAEKLSDNFATQLQQMLTPYRSAGCPIRIDYYRSDAKGQVYLGQDWQVKPTDELIQRLREAYGREQVRLVY